METKSEAVNGDWPVPTAQQMLERCIVPVKAEFLVRKGPSRNIDATLPASDALVANSAPTADKKQNREQEQSRSESRRQMRKEVRAGRPAELCTNHLLGRCTWGERCKYSHDLAGYLRTKPADLPGSCPWTVVQAKCPYGIMCRYARSHGVDDELHRVLATVLPADGVGLMAVDGSDAAVVASAETDGGVAPVPVPVLGSELPLPTSIEKEVNYLSKDIQNLLWKKRYDYSKADGILKSMDLRISFKGASKPDTGNDGGSGEKREPVESGPQKAEVVENVQPAPAEGGEGLAGQGHDGMLLNAGSAVAEVEAPTQVDAAANLAAELGSQGPPDGDADAVEGPAAKRQRTGDTGSGGGDGTDAHPTAADAVTVALPVSDAAALATLTPEQHPGKEAAVTASGTDSPTGHTAAVVSEARLAHVEVPLRPSERRRLDFRGKTYLAPLTTVGNLPFRRTCKSLGVDVTCGEMALATNLLQGQMSEWALLKRHPCEDFFGVQVCGGYPDALARVGQLLGEQIQVDFVDINMGCPIDLVCDKKAGSALLRQPGRIERILRATSKALGDTPLTFKTRKGYNDGEDVAHTFLHKAGEWGAAAVTLHGRTRQQRYSKLADWEYIHRCGESCAAAGLQLIGNGDVFSYLDWNQHMNDTGGHLASLMIGRGALIKPWIFTEIKEQRHWDISASERLELYKQFCSFGLEHWGSDSRGVETTRRFLLEWLSFTCRYVPVGLLEVLPQQMNHRPPAFRGRNELETLLASEDSRDWVRISEMLLGPPPAPISFAAKHKSNSYTAPGTASELDMARG
ncbi:hypothetical protein Vretimale_9270 [Volvox reticuliferus]|uniref:tRNA-dihydrouridine(47) synthase [NAD(P)(+)] n=1 Tax=Volvox reticuliferus TaxID=1737510 RepID=A0A8J4CJ62_9CHLO|nr:hypothetical protein Vretifemale_10001 [Volvox reticuliferus]GIM04659.1 hypothetical protein Vretimale_9270 [Volvox reticuliferus]